MSSTEQPGSDTAVRVVLANDSELVLRGLRSLLDPYGARVRIVGVAVGEPDLSRYADTDCDVMLVDAHDREGGGLSAASTVLNADPEFSVAVFTDTVDERLVLQALRLGVRGYLLKNQPAEHLVDSLERLARGELVIDGDLAARAAVMAARSMHLEPWPGAHLGLTRRESEVLLLLAAGAGTDEISSTLDRSRETVRSHLKGIFRKLGVGDRAAAVSVAWREGVVPATGTVSGEGTADTGAGAGAGRTGRTDPAGQAGQAGQSKGGDATRGRPAFGSSTTR